MPADLLHGFREVLRAERAPRCDWFSADLTHAVLAVVPARPSCFDRCMSWSDCRDMVAPLIPFARRDVEAFVAGVLARVGFHFSARIRSLTASSCRCHDPADTSRQQIGQYVHSGRMRHTFPHRGHSLCTSRSPIVLVLPEKMPSHRDGFPAPWRSARRRSRASRLRRVHLDP